MKKATSLHIHENVPLAPYTTLGVGGPARFLIKASLEEQIPEALEYARARSCPVFILGGGSNIVVSDSGFSGLVLKIEILGIQSPGGDSDAPISAGAGVEWDAFVQHCVNQNLAGIECLSGIPGTVGGAPIQNIGAYGEEVGEVISAVKVLDRNTGDIAEFANTDCHFAYRSSIFNTTQPDRYILLRVDFALRSDGIARLHYQDLQRYFSGDTKPTDIRQVREAILQIRKSKAMIVCQDDPDSKSVGSFFRNPVLNPTAMEKMENELRARGFLGSNEKVPRFDMPDGKVKIPAAWLIEHAGFNKGYEYGCAAISGKHALAIINRGGATAQNIVDLMHRIQTRVHESFHITLHPEPVFVGFTSLPTNH
jgi:UDP-N-acetylmuramate dehydrogenase